MKKFILFAILAISAAAGLFFRIAPLRGNSPAGIIYYVSPTGNDNNLGTTVGAPFATWQKLSSVMHAGDKAYIRGGTYRTTQSASAGQHCLWQNMNGTSSDSIWIMNYPGETPVFNLDNISPTNSDPTILVIQNCSYLHIKGIRVTGLAQRSNGAGVSRAIDFRGSSHNLIELVEADHIGGYGFILSDNSNDNYFLNCDAHHMDDRLTTGGGAWGNANGFQCTGGSSATRNTFDGCRAWWISDDGFDLYAVNGEFTFKNCEAFWNGYEPGTFVKRGDGDGFKLGPHKSGTPLNTTIVRTLVGCRAFENARAGFDQNDGNLGTRMYNCASFKNGGKGFQWDYVSPAPTCDFKNNWAYLNTEAAYTGSEISGTTNSWSGGGISLSGSDFLSTSSAGADGARQIDGSLPSLNFLRPSSTSKLINAGTKLTGISYTGSGPEIGPYEYPSTVVPSIETFSFQWIKSTARRRDIKIDWNGKPVQGSKYFTIQRKDKSFSTIGTQEAVSGQADYSFYDKPTLNGTYTYRVLHFDQDGNVITSNTTKVSFTKGKSFISSLNTELSL